MAKANPSTTQPTDDAKTTETDEPDPKVLIAQLQAQLAEEREKTEKMLATAPSLRKTFAKATGKHVAKSHYRITVDTKEKADALVKQGLVATPVYDPAEPKKIMLYASTIPAPPEVGPAPAYSLPEEIVEHGVKCGALEPELA
jgi:hypothetical protein